MIDLLARPAAIGGADGGTTFPRPSSALLEGAFPFHLPCRSLIEKPQSRFYGRGRDGLGAIALNHANRFAGGQPIQIVSRPYLIFLRDFLRQRELELTGNPSHSLHCNKDVILVNSLSDGPTPLSV